MRGRGRGRGSWRTAPPPPPPSLSQNNQIQEQAFDPPPANNPDEYYQQEEIQEIHDEMGGGDIKMEGDGQEMTEDGEGDMEGEPLQQQPEGGTRKRPWERPGGVKVKRKKVPGAKNIKIRKYVQPKNAVMCLNELRPGVVYSTEQEGNVGTSFCITVEVPGAIDGQKYRGYGSSKQLAKQAAAEAALISFVKPPIMSDSGDEDKTPWATLASFAIYKLFNEWREGKVGMCSPAQSYRAAIPPGVKAFLSQPHGMNEDPAQATAFSEAISAHLGGRISHTDGRSGTDSGSIDTKALDAAKVPNPAKQVPESAAGMHPVMVLHQMKPGVHYDVTQDTRDNKPFFIVKAEIDGTEFTGEGVNVKKAKFNLAKAALSGLFNIESVFEG